MSEQYYQDLMHRLEAAPHGDRAKLVCSAANMLGKSTMTIYRHLKKIGYTTGRKNRVDKGKSALSINEIKQVAALMRASDRANKKKLLSAKVAIEIASQNKLIGHECHEATINRLMKTHGVHPKQMKQAKPHVMLASRHPNHMWQIDPSFCVLYYLKDGRSMSVMDEAIFYKNKPNNFHKIAKDRVLRYVCTDHTTGAFYCYYYNTPGESEEVMIDFLLRAMGTKDRQKNPFEGVPKILYWDKGSANKSQLVKSLLSGLGIDHIAHTKGNSRAKGSVEQHNNIIECNFEGRLAFHKITSMAQLNQACEAWQRYFQSNVKYKHYRHGMPRFQAWRKIKPDELVFRPPLEVCKALLSTESKKRTIKGNYQISYGNRAYSLSEVDHIAIGESVKVNINPFNYPNLFVTYPNRFGEDVRYEIPPLDIDEYGFTSDSVMIDGHHQQAALTHIDRNRIDLDEIAYGTRDEQEVDKLRSKKSVAAFAQKVDALGYLSKADAENDQIKIPKRGKALEVNTKKAEKIDNQYIPKSVVREEPVLPVLAFIKWYAKHYPISSELNKKIRDEYGSGVKECDYELIANKLQVSKLKVVNY